MPPMRWLLLLAAVTVVPSASAATPASLNEPKKFQLTQSYPTGVCTSGLNAIIDQGGNCGAGLGCCKIYNGGAGAPGNGLYECCSSSGFCGVGDAWCGTGCQPAYGRCGSGTATTNQDCVWGDWGSWSCSATCGTGVLTRTRSKTTVESGTGTCSGSSSDATGGSCNTNSCSGGGGGGGGTGTCSAGLKVVNPGDPCGAGVGCCPVYNAPGAPGNGLVECCSSIGFCGVSDQHCGTGCQSPYGRCGSGGTTPSGNCVWGDWGSWTCSASCGGGTLTRNRTKTTVETTGTCSGSYTDSVGEACNTNSCGSSYSCSVADGNAFRLTFLVCAGNPQSALCYSLMGTLFQGQLVSNPCAACILMNNMNLTGVVLCFPPGSIEWRSGGICSQADAALIHPTVATCAMGTSAMCTASFTSIMASLTANCTTCIETSPTDFVYILGHCFGLDEQGTNTTKPCGAMELGLLAQSMWPCFWSSSSTSIQCTLAWDAFWVAVQPDSGSCRRCILPRSGNLTSVLTTCFDGGLVVPGVSCTPNDALIAFSTIYTACAANFTATACTTAVASLSSTSLTTTCKACVATGSAASGVTGLASCFGFVVNPVVPPFCGVNDVSVATSVTQQCMTSLASVSCTSAISTSLSSVSLSCSSCVGSLATNASAVMAYCFPSNSYCGSTVTTLTPAAGITIIFRLSCSIIISGIQYSNVIQTLNFISGVVLQFTEITIGVLPTYIQTWTQVSMWALSIVSKFTGTFNATIIQYNLGTLPSCVTTWSNVTFMGCPTGMQCMLMGMLQSGSTTVCQVMYIQQPVPPSNTYCGTVVQTLQASGVIQFSFLASCILSTSTLYSNMVTTLTYTFGAILSLTSISFGVLPLFIMNWMTPIMWPITITSTETIAFNTTVIVYNKGTDACLTTIPNATFTNCPPGFQCMLMGMPGNSTGATMTCVIMYMQQTAVSTNSFCGQIVPFIQSGSLIQFQASCTLSGIYSMYSNVVQILSYTIGSILSFSSISFGVAPLFIINWQNIAQFPISITITQTQAFNTTVVVYVKQTGTTCVTSFSNVVVTNCPPGMTCSVMGMQDMVNASLCDVMYMQQIVTANTTYCGQVLAPTTMFSGVIQFQTSCTVTQLIYQSYSTVIQMLTFYSGAVLSFQSITINSLPVFIMNWVNPVLWPIVIKSTQTSSYNTTVIVYVNTMATCATTFPAATATACPPGMQCTITGAPSMTNSSLCQVIYTQTPVAPTTSLCGSMFTSLTVSSVVNVDVTCQVTQFYSTVVQTLVYSAGAALSFSGLSSTVLAMYIINWVNPAQWPILVMNSVTVAYNSTLVVYYTSTATCVTSFPQAAVTGCPPGYSCSIMGMLNPMNSSLCNVMYSQIVAPTKTPAQQFGCSGTGSCAINTTPDPITGSVNFSSSTSISISSSSTLVISSGGTAILSGGSLSGGGAMSISSGGTLSVTSSSSISTSTTFSTGSTLSVVAGAILSVASTMTCVGNTISGSSSSFLSFVAGSALAVSSQVTCTAALQLLSGSSMMMNTGCNLQVGSLMSLAGNTISGLGTMTLSSTSSVTVASAVTCAAAMVMQTGSSMALSAGSSMMFSNTVTLAGTVTAAASAVMNFASTSAVTISSAFSSAAAMVFMSGCSMALSDTMTVLNSLTLNGNAITGSGTMAIGPSSTVMVASSTTTTTSVTMSSGSMMTISPSSSMTFSGSSVSLTGSSIMGGGSATFSSSTMLTVSNTVMTNVAMVAQSGCSMMLNSGSNFQVIKSLSLTGNTISGTGQMTIAQGASLVVSSTVAIASAVVVQASSVVTLVASSVMTISNSLSITGSTISGLGTMTLSSTSTVTIASAVTWAAVMVMQTGSSMALSAGASMMFSNTVTLAGTITAAASAIMNFAATSVVTISSAFSSAAAMVFMSGCSMIVSDTMTVLNSLTLNGNAVTGSGTMAISSSSTVTVASSTTTTTSVTMSSSSMMTISSSSSMTFSGSSVSLTGSSLMGGGSAIFSSSTMLTVANTVMTSVAMVAQSGCSIMLNSGSNFQVTKSLSLTGNTISGTGQLTIAQSASLVVSSTVAIASAVVVQASSVLTLIASSVMTISKSITITSSTVSGAGQMMISSGAALTIASVVSVASTMVLSSGSSFTLNSDAMMQVQGLLTLAGATVTSSATSVMTFASTAVLKVTQTAFSSAAILTFSSGSQVTMSSTTTFTSTNVATLMGATITGGTFAARGSTTTLNQCQMLCNMLCGSSTSSRRRDNRVDLTNFATTTFCGTSNPNTVTLQNQGAVNFQGNCQVSGSQYANNLNALDVETTNGEQVFSNVSSSSLPTYIGTWTNPQNVPTVVSLTGASGAYSTYVAVTNSSAVCTGGLKSSVENCASGYTCSVSYNNAYNGNQCAVLVNQVANSGSSNNDGLLGLIALVALLPLALCAAAAAWYFLRPKQEVAPQLLRPEPSYMPTEYPSMTPSGYPSMVYMYPTATPMPSPSAYLSEMPMEMYPSVVALPPGAYYA